MVQEGDGSMFYLSHNGANAPQWFQQYFLVSLEKAVAVIDI